MATKWWYKSERWIGIGIAVGLIGLIIYNLYWQALPQAAIGFLPTLPGPERHDTILVFSPHPDDESLGSAGFLSNAIKAGASVWVILVTDGNKHGMEKERYSEFNAALDQLKIPAGHRIFLGYPDGELNQSKPADIKAKFSAIITQVHPTIALVPHPCDVHPDHRITGQIADGLLLTSSTRVYHYLVHFPHFPFPAKLIPDDYLLPPLRLISLQEQWYQYPLSTSTVDLKLATLLNYKSQLKNLFLRKIFYGSVRRNELFSWANPPHS